MNYSSWIVFILLILLVGSLILICFGDSDIITFLAERYGWKPFVVYWWKVVWITGAASGIGEALAKELAKFGTYLILSDTNQKELERVRLECLRENKILKNQDVLVLPFDPTHHDAHKSSLEIIVSKFGKMDVLIHTTGIIAPEFDTTRFHETEDSVEQNIFNINTFSVIKLTRVVVERFLRFGGGQIVLVSGPSSKIPVPTNSTYCASKYALQGYFNSLRAEMSEDDSVDVTIVSPEIVETPLFGKNNMGLVPSMKMDRTAYLCLVAMANHITEAWIAKWPRLPFLYLFHYLPWIARRLFNRYYQKGIMEKWAKKRQWP